MDEGLSKKRGAHISGRLKNYMRWPIAMAIMLLLLNLWIYCIDNKAVTLMLIFMLIYIVGIGILYVYSRSLIMKDLIEFAAQYGVVQNTLLKELSVPYEILLEDGQLLWMNDQFERLFGDTAQKDKYLSRYIPELNRSIFPKEENDVVEMDVYYEDREYKAELRRVSVEGFSETEQLLELPAEREYFIAVYLQDVTELNRYIKENEEQRLVAGLIYIDNYDEVMNSVEEVRQSLLVALVDRKINQYIAKADGIVKKTETDKYFIALKKQEFKRLEDDKFSLLEDVTIKGVTISASGFYGPQGRVLRLPLAMPDMVHKFETFNYKGNKITNFEMEGSAIAGLSGLLGHDAATVCCIIANRHLHESQPDYKPYVKRLIETALERLAK